MHTEICQVLKIIDPIYLDFHFQNTWEVFIFIKYMLGLYLPFSLLLKNTDISILVVF